MIVLRSIGKSEALHFYTIHPHLQDMWRRYYWNPLVALFLRRKVDGHIERWAIGDKDWNPSEVLVIEKNGKSIGFTGFFKDGSCPSDTLRMRWTAVIEDEQGQGAARDAIGKLCEYIHGKFPDVRWISESCPSFTKSLQRWFKGCGFEAWDDAEKDGTGIPFVRTVSLRRGVGKAADSKG